MALLASFAVAALLIELTPGPNMTWLAVLTLTRGRGAGVQAVAGVSTGLAVLGVAAALGVAVLVQSSPLLYEILRWAGVAYFVYLAWDIWTGPADGHAAEQAVSVGRPFRQGLITNLLNPKAALFYVTVPPRFISADHDVTGQLLMLIVVYVAVATLVHLAIVLLAAWLRSRLEGDRWARPVRRGFAVAMLGVAGWLALSTGRA